MARFRIPFLSRTEPSDDEQRSLEYGQPRVDLARLLLNDSGNALSRRYGRSAADIAATNSAVYAAIRKRSVSITKPRITIVREIGGQVIEVNDHPALQTLRRVNSGLTFKQGIALIEQYKLTYGEAFMLKRRDASGKTREFAFVDPSRVEILPEPEQPWVAAKYRITNPGGTTVYTVDAADVIPLRHMIDLRNPLRGLSPISAARVAIDSGYEAQRFNSRFFDQGVAPGTLYSLEDASPAEAQRVAQMLETNMKGTDGAYRSMVIDGTLKAVNPSISNKDMEFLSLLNFGVAEIARVFELSPTTLGIGDTTFSNTEAGDTGLWETVVTQLEFTLSELDEFFLAPEYGDEFHFVVDTSNIPALQGDAKLAAEITDLRLRGGVITVNEVRATMGLSPVSWGDTPLVQAGVTSLGAAPAAEPVVEESPAIEEEEKQLPDSGDDGNEPRSFKRAAKKPKAMSTTAQTDLLENGFRARLSKERAAILKHVTKGGA